MVLQAEGLRVHGHGGRGEVGGELGLREVALNDLGHHVGSTLGHGGDYSVPPGAAPGRMRPWPWEAQMRPRDLVGMLKEAFADWREDNAPRLGAALSYYTA